MPNDFKTTRLYLACTLDPLHIGTGEFQLGRVDNLILRESGTGLPKIPGTSLAGAARANTAMKEERYRHNQDGKECLCAGKGGEGGEAHCGKSDCPVCISYGFSKGNFSFQGLAQFSDANLLFYPVPTLCGPMWLTSPDALASAGIETGVKREAWEAALNGGNDGPELWTSNEVARTCQRLNAGWLYFPVMRAGPAGLRAAPGRWTLHGKLLAEVADLAPILSRIVVISDRFYSLIVEDQLEVRTTVSIDPSTGAAAGGALFTFEAVPRGAFFCFWLTVLDPKLFRNPIPKSSLISFEKEKIEGYVQGGLELVEWLGIGGSNTRGMGRTRIRPVVEVSDGVA